MAQAVKVEVEIFPENEPPDFSVDSWHLGVGGVRTRGLEGASAELEDPDVTALAELFFEEYPENGDPSP